jgi:tRNA threonylcarbamoyladenosine biosynthesis protein TsaE
MKTVQVQEENELLGVGEELVASMSLDKEAHVLTLQGDLGAGKTALTKAIATTLGIREHVTSPTFVIMKSYEVRGHPRYTSLTHIDAYRIDDEEELQVLGFPELLMDTSRLIVIEWPERVAGLIPEDALNVSIQIEDTGERTITYDEK